LERFDIPKIRKKKRFDEIDKLENESDLDSGSDFLSSVSFSESSSSLSNNSSLKVTDRFFL
jgi:hypothetical protein